MLKCNFCGEENSEVTEHKFVPVTALDWVAYSATFGQIKHKLCQKCNSKIFRGLMKNK